MTLTVDTGGKKMVMVFDFDGTISVDDVFDSLFYRFAHRLWLDAHRKYHDHEISMKEAYCRMASHFRGNLEDVYTFLRETARLRPGFKELLERLYRQQVKTMIVSNGFDFYLYYLLDLWQVDCSKLEILCHHAEITNNRFIPRFQEHQNLRHGQCLIGKAEIVNTLRDQGYFASFAGNGDSDTPASRVADLVFARDRLAEFCKKNGIDFVPFSDFFKISDYFFGEH